jgi:hypothetical protein
MLQSKVKVPSWLTTSYLSAPSSKLSPHKIKIRWKEYWRQDLKLDVRNLSMSPIGDFFSMTGDGFMTVWIRDTPTDFTYSQFVYHSREDTKGIIAQVIKQLPTLGSIIQQEVTNDGRLIICLENRATTLKIYY